jgi:hypothetical protein
MMAVVNWVNATGGAWNTGSNWSTGSVPGANVDRVLVAACVSIVSWTLSMRRMVGVHVWQFGGSFIFLALVSQIYFYLKEEPSLCRTDARQIRLCLTFT